MKTDAQLQKDVLAELEWEPSVDHADIGVSVVDGVVSLNGFVKNFAEKVAAERAARRVEGVRAIAEELHVRFASDPKTADHEIARRILDMFAWNVSIPENQITVKVERGWVALEGKVQWHFQSEAAKKAVAEISGVTGVSNHILVAERPATSDIERRIMDAFRRQAGLDAQGVTVSLAGGTVRLDGNVRTWHERQVAEDAAWAAPGVTRVEDRIMVR